MDLQQRLEQLHGLDKAALRAQWLELFKRPAPRLRKDLLIRILAYRLQEQAYGGLSVANCNRLRRLAHGRQPLDLTFEKLWNVPLSRAEQRRRDRITRE